MSKGLTILCIDDSEAPILGLQAMLEKIAGAGKDYAFVSDWNVVPCVIPQGAVRSDLSGAFQKHVTPVLDDIDKSQPVVVLLDLALAWDVVERKHEFKLGVDAPSINVDGLEWMPLLKERGGADLPVFAWSVWGTEGTTDQVTRIIELVWEKGGDGLIWKHWAVDCPDVVVTRILEKVKPRDWPDELFGGMVLGASALENELRDLIKVYSTTKSTVMIRGETGVGKELAAHAIHRLGDRRKKPFVVVNCGSITESLFESELFGHVKGSFTDAIRDKKGYFLAANGGTIFLDEIGELSPALQVKFLRVLQESEVVRVGETEPKKIDVRVIAATNKDLEERLESGKFREDLYYRVNVLPLAVPPLRTRRNTIPRLVELFAVRFGAEQGKGKLNVDQQAMEALVEYDWPGNVRELMNVLERAVVMVRDGDTITLDCVSENVRYGEVEGKDDVPESTSRAMDKTSSLVWSLSEDALRNAGAIGGAGRGECTLKDMEFGLTTSMGQRPVEISNLLEELGIDKAEKLFSRSGVSLIRLHKVTVWSKGKKFKYIDSGIGSKGSIESQKIPRLVRRVLTKFLDQGKGEGR